MLSIEQKDYILSHLRRPENDAEIAKIAFEISQHHGAVSPEVAFVTATLMNLGETDPRIAYIYDASYNWKEHPEAITLNKLHGEYSVEMAKGIGITLSEEQEQVICGHSKNEYASDLGQIIKIAEICRATEQPRWYRGEKKEAAKSWEEVASVLYEDKALSPKMIEHAKASYGKARFPELKISKTSHDTNDGELS